MTFGFANVIQADPLVPETSRIFRRCLPMSLAFALAFGLAFGLIMIVALEALPLDHLPQLSHEKLEV